MTRPHKLQAELAALRAELAHAPTAQDSKSRASAACHDEPRPADTAMDHELTGQLEELRTALADYVGVAESLASDYPLLLAGAAFLLGVGVGRLTKRG